MAEIILLNRIRVDIGNVSGSLSELMQYSNFAGFNDNYEPQEKPRLVGTWTINDWYTVDQLEEAKSKFDMADPEHEHTGLTIIEDPTLAIDFDEIAVQTIDPEQPNYNPAVAIILQAAGYGNTTSAPPISGQTGRYIFTKTQAASITTIGGEFQNKTTVTDINGIVSSDTSATYDFETFNEFEYFSGITTIGHVFWNCGKLKTIRLNDNITKTTGGSSGEGLLANCAKLESVNIPNRLTVLGNFAFTGDKSLRIPIEFPSTVISFNYGCMYGCDNLAYVHITSLNVPNVSQNSFSGSFKVYVGDGSSAANDDAILADYIADTNWSTYSSRLDTWYNYLHPTT